LKNALKLHSEVAKVVHGNKALDFDQNLNGETDIPMGKVFPHGRLKPIHHGRVHLFIQ
jgi:hypothetical protein